MENTPTMVCPVCGKSRQSTNSLSCKCNACGFKSAFVELFPNKTSRILWQQLAIEFKEKQIKERRSDFIGSDCFTLGGKAISLYLKSSGIMYIIHYDGTIEQEEGALKFSSSERNYSILYSDGSVKVFGTDDANYGVLKTENWKGMKAVFSAPNCTYGVSEEGKIVSAGSVQYPETKSWKEIVKLAGGTKHLLGLKQDGRVVATGEFPDPANRAAIEKWTNVVDIAASRDASLALHEDGKVSFAGKKNDARNEVKRWEHISAIAMDNRYAVGLTQEGRVLLAGRCSKPLDKGRSAAADWDNIIAISCIPIGIGAITEMGDLLLAGSIPGEKDKILNAWNKTIKSRIELT